MILSRFRSFLFLFALPAAAVAAGGLQPKDLVAICGDSITEQKLYSVFMEDYLLMCQPQPDLQAFQAGWSGETAKGFIARVKNDVLPFKPTVATTCYGMNDGGYNALTPERATLYREAMEDTVKAFKDNGVRFIVVGGPGAVDTDFFKKTAPDVYNKTLSDLTAIAKEIAEKNGTAFADVHTPMMETMAAAKAKYGAQYPVCGGDGVHPGANGHLVMAYAFLKALGCDGNVGTITCDLASDKATATEGHKVLASAGGKIEVESTRYPFCFFGNPDDPAATAGIIEFLPFNQDLNRYQLVVKNATAPKLKVTWGKTSKEFTKEELEKGVNLAAEFLDNPFSEPFKTVQAAIQAQQAFETPAIKTLLHSLLEWRGQLPGAANYDALESDVIKKDITLREASRAAVKPVKHTLVIEPAA